MNLEQTATLLGLCAAYDQRTTGEIDVEAWYAILGHLDFEDCRTAVIGHYGDSTDRIMPAHVKMRVRAIKQARSQTLEQALAIPNANPDDVEDYLRAVRSDDMRTPDPEELKERPELKALGAGCFQRIEDE